MEASPPSGEASPSWRMKATAERWKTASEAWGGDCGPRVPMRAGRTVMRPENPTASATSLVSRRLRADGIRTVPAPPGRAPSRERPPERVRRAPRITPATHSHPAGPRRRSPLPQRMPSAPAITVPGPTSPRKSAGAAPIPVIPRMPQARATCHPGKSARRPRRPRWATRSTRSRHRPGSSPESSRPPRSERLRGHSPPPMVRRGTPVHLPASVARRPSSRRRSPGRSAAVSSPYSGWSAWTMATSTCSPRW